MPLTQVPAGLLDSYAQSLSFKNRIINGAMTISQRGSSFASAGGYTLDRWSYNAVTSAVATITQHPDFPSSVSDFTASLRFAVTTADTSIAATDIAYIRQKVEGFNARSLLNNPLTLSFWVRSSKTGVHCVSFASSGTDRSYVAEYTVNAADTWEFKSITIPGGLNNSAGTWDWANGVGVDIRWALASGSNFNTTAGAWQAGNLFATSNQVNVLDSTSNIFALTGVQLEEGLTATAFDYRPYGIELALCQRYFQKLGSLVAGGYPNGSTGFVNWFFKVEMRVAPTITYFTGSTVTTNNVSTDTVLGYTAAGTYPYIYGGTTASAEL